MTTYHSMLQHKHAYVSRMVAVDTACEAIIYSFSTYFGWDGFACCLAYAVFHQKAEVVARSTHFIVHDHRLTLAHHLKIAVTAHATRVLTTRGHDEVVALRQLVSGGASRTRDRICW